MVILEHSISNKDLRDNFLNTHNIPKDSSVVYLEGTKTTTRTPTADTDLHFRQESNFFYLTGCVEPDCAALFNLATNEAVLLVPRYGDEYALWCGDYPTREDFAKKLEFTSVEYNEGQVITQLLKKWNAETVYCLEQYRDSLYNIVGGSVKIDASKTLYLALKDARLIKNAREVDQIRKCCQIAAEAHVACMKLARPGINEYELEAELQRVVRSKGCKHLAYPAIIAGDDRGATLHYVNNDQVIHDGSLVLIDAGGEVPTLYASDITRVFPVNGKFTDEQKLIYNIVLNANKKVIERVKPGVEWAELHRYANRLMTEDMWKAGFLKADSLEELIDNHVGALFFPHGLGHSLGLDVHDPPNRDGSFTAYDQPGIKYLRTNAILKPGMVLTVEPGIYFIPRFLNSAFNNPSLSKYLVREKIEQFYKFGGVRIEDDLVVTENGSEVFTTGVPKEVDQIEQLMNN